MSEVTEQRQMNNEYVNIIFKLHSTFFINIANKKPRGQPSDVTVPALPLSSKKNYVVEEFSADRQRAIIWWNHYLTT